MMRPILLIAILATTACGASVSYAPFRSAPVTRQLTPDVVEVFYTPPRCPFVELGMLESQTKFANTEDGLYAMREAAGARGADGIILIDHQDTGGDHGGATHSYGAIAIARDPACVGDPASQYIGQANRDRYRPAAAR